MLDVRKLLPCKYVYYYVNASTWRDVKGLKEVCGAAQQKRTTIPDDGFRLCAADGPDGGLCVWSGPAMMKMALFFPWFSKCHFTEHVSPQEPPIVSRCPLMAEQQVNGVHMEKGCCQRVNN